MDLLLNILVGNSGSVELNSEMVMKMHCRWFRRVRRSDINFMKLCSKLKYMCIVIF